LSAGGKRAVLKWHRRSGKDDVGLHHVACSAMERVGNYWYMLPEYSQARKSMWDAVNGHSGKRRIDEAFPKEIRKRYLEQEMAIHFPNGSTFQLVGSDNFNSLVGSPPVGLVFSEYAISDPSAWSYLMPILEENGGWALFNSTPRGNNHFKKLCDFAQKEPGWFFDSRNADQTNVYKPKQLESIKRALIAEHGTEYGTALFMQEYYVSFDAAIPGSIFGEWLDRAKNAGRIKTVSHDPALPVHTAWDLGYEDATAIWFWQVFRGEIRLISYFESHLKDIDFYAEELRKRKTAGQWEYGTHWLPPDARARTLAAGGKTIHQQMIDQKVGRVAIVKKVDLMDQVQAARKTMGSCWFDQDGCSKGLEALGNYHYEYDPENKVFSQKPLHDWSSHGSSAYMTMSLAWREVVQQGKEPSFQEALLAGSVNTLSIGALRDAHFRKFKSAKAERFN